MTLLNPLGLLALFAIPLVIAIHFLQRRAQHLPISTLFLLNKTQRESASGRKFDRLMNSVPLWLQLLIVLLITWLLVQPRYIKANSTQRIAIVLDSSASMSVFKKELETKIQEIIPELQATAENAEVWVLESDSSKPRIYHGNDILEMSQAVSAWQPNTGATEPSHSLRIARSLAGNEGAVVYLTDTPRESISYNAHLYSVGSNKENVGFTGISFSSQSNQLIWKTLLRNYSDKAVTRTWYLENESGQRTPPREVTIQARKIVSLQGAFPENSNTAKLILSSDAFELDNVLPMVRPIPKTILIHSHQDLELISLAESIRESFPNITTNNDPSSADVHLLDSTEINNLTKDSILFNQIKGIPKSYLTGSIVAEKHPLMEGLNWQALLVKNTPSIQHTETDDVLLWQGKRPLIFLRSLAGNRKVLIFNFALQHSNISKTEAAVVLLLRFIERIREQKMSHQQMITETSQPINLITSNRSIESPLTFKTTLVSSGKNHSTTVKEIQSSSNLYAPDRPSFYTISQQEQPLLTAANYFADTREADFSVCSESYLPASSNATAVDRHTREDHLWRYWVILALFAVFASWHYSKTR